VLASHLFFPEQLYPWLTLVSGALVLSVGLGFFVQTVRNRGHVDTHHHHHDHSHLPAVVGASRQFTSDDDLQRDDRLYHGEVGPHRHGEHAHVHKELTPTWRNLFALGLAGGIVPSGSALVVLLS